MLVIFIVGHFACNRSRDLRNRSVWSKLSELTLAKPKQSRTRRQREDVRNFQRTH